VRAARRKRATCGRRWITSNPASASTKHNYRRGKGSSAEWKKQHRQRTHDVSAKYGCEAYCKALGLYPPADVRPADYLAVQLALVARHLRSAAKLPQSSATRIYCLSLQQDQHRPTALRLKSLPRTKMDARFRTHDLSPSRCRRGVSDTPRTAARRSPCSPRCAWPPASESRGTTLDLNAPDGARVGIALMVRYRRRGMALAATASRGRSIARAPGMNKRSAGISSHPPTALAHARLKARDGFAPPPP